MLHYDTMVNLIRATVETSHDFIGDFCNQMESAMRPKYDVLQDSAGGIPWFREQYA